MQLRVYSAVLGALVALLLLPVFSYAQTNVGDAISGTIEGVITDKFKEETGLDTLEDIKGDIDAVKDLDVGALADKTVEYVRGEVPSQVMSNLVTQITVGPDLKTPTPFSNLFLKKDPYGNRTKIISACHLAVNEKMRAGLFELRVRGHFSPWIDIAWEAVKNIAGGGKGIADLIAEHTKAKAEELIKDALFGEQEEPKVEVYTYEHGDSCDTVTKVTWDPVNYRLIAVTSGDCKCEQHETECGPTRLKGFQAVLVAPVVTSVRIQTEERLFGWLSSKHTIQASYRVDLDRMKLSTYGDCGPCEDIVDPPPEEEGFWTGVWGWIKDIFVSEPEDRTDPPEDEGEASEDGDGTEAGSDDDSSGDDDTTGTGFLGGLFGGEDKTEEPEDQPEGSNEEDGTEEEEDKPLQCGDTVSVDGRSGVPTFPYRPDPSGDVNFSCNNSCGPDQVCKVLPESVGAFRSSCVYCADKPKEDPPPPPPPVTGGKCEQAVRLLLDEYLGWFDPPVTFSANGAVFLNGPYRCFGPDVYEEHHRSLVNEGVADSQIKAMCPSLRHVSSEEIHLGGEGKGATCNSKTLFSF